MIAVGLACFLAGLMVGLLLQGHTKTTVYSRHHKDKTADVTTQLPRKVTQLSGAVATRAFNIRPSFAQRRARWEDAHNSKAKMNASIAEQIRKAQEGTLR